LGNAQQFVRVMQDKETLQKISPKGPRGYNDSCKDCKTANTTKGCCVIL